MFNNYSYDKRNYHFNFLEIAEYYQTENTQKFFFRDFFYDAPIIGKRPA